MDVKDDAKSNAANEAGEQALQQTNATGHIPGSAPKPCRNIPCRSGTQGNGNGNQKHLHDSVGAGVGVTVNDVTHGIGKQQPGHKNHQRTDCNHVGITGNAHCLQGIGQQRHWKCRCDGAEELVGLQVVHEPVDNAHQ